MQSSCSAQGFTRTHYTGGIKLCHNFKAWEKLRCWEMAVPHNFISSLLNSKAQPYSQHRHTRDIAISHHMGQQVQGLFWPLHAPLLITVHQRTRIALITSEKPPSQHWDKQGAAQWGFHRIKPMTCATTASNQIELQISCWSILILNLKTTWALFPAMIVISIFSITHQFEVKMTWQIVLWHKHSIWPKQLAFADEILHSQHPFHI